MALGKGGSSRGAPSALTPLRTTDAVLMGSAAVVLLAPRFLEEHEVLRLDAGPDCGPGTVNAFDRKVRTLALGDRSLEKREMLGLLSWATEAAAIIQPIAVTLSADAPHKWSRDLPIWGEAAAVSIAVDQAVKHLVHRRRPYARFCEPQRTSDLCSTDADLSFYSGHTSAAFVAAVAAGRIASFHHQSNQKWVWVSGLTLATATGALRVTADRHYATDVLAGAFAGGLAGWLIPKVHRPDPISTVQRAASSRRARPGVAIPLTFRTASTTTFVSAGIADGGPSLQVHWRW
jgi:membrane-associated phospholipid phosphatase